MVSRFCQFVFGGQQHLEVGLCLREIGLHSKG